MLDHDFDFDPTAGYSPEELRRVRPPEEVPDDFDDFWLECRRQAMSVPLNLSKKRIWSPDEDVELFEIFFDSLDGVRIGGWLARPKNSKRKNSLGKPKNSGKSTTSPSGYRAPIAPG